MNQNRDNKLSFERHLQTIIQVLIVGLLGWFGVETIATSKTVVRLEEQIINLKDSIKDAAGDRYRRADAEADQAIIFYRIGSLEKWRDQINERVKRLENGEAETR